MIGADHEPWWQSLLSGKMRAVVEGDMEGGEKVVESLKARGHTV